jgi:hypothetical protein
MMMIIIINQFHIVLFHFSGDIGGSIGLFIGASVMTVFEILDFIINNALVNTIYKNKRK